MEGFIYIHLKTWDVFKIETIINVPKFLLNLIAASDGGESVSINSVVNFRDPWIWF